MSENPTDTTHRSTDSDVDLLSEDTMETLLLHARPRANAPIEIKNSVFEAVQGAWQDKVERRAAQRRHRVIWALAASVLLAVGVGWLLTRTDSTLIPVGVVPQTVATVEAWQSPSPSPYALGTALGPGDELATLGTERAALRLRNGFSLRLDHDTRIRLLTGRTVELMTGTVYVDSGGTGSSGDNIEIRTHLGHTTDIGTQFEVRLGDGGLRVQVREGAVRVDVDGRSHAAEAGTEIAVDAAGTVHTTALPQDRDWSWVMEAAPTFELDGSTVAEALHWVSRETGWTVSYEDPELEQEAATIVTRGSLSGLTPAQAPELIIPTAGLTYSRDGPTLHVRRADP